MACPVAMHSCQPNQSIPPHASAPPIVCHGRSFDSALTKSKSSNRSHSGGPLGTNLLITHSWELNTQVVLCTPTPEDHLVLLLTIHSWDFHALLTPPAWSAGPCWFLLSLHVAPCRGLSIHSVHSRGPLSVLPTPTDSSSHVASHPSIGLPRILVHFT
jgi:hypothetical protein